MSAAAACRSLDLAWPRAGLGAVGLRAFEREKRLPPLDSVAESHLDSDDAAGGGQEQAGRSVGVDPDAPRGHDSFNGDLVHAHRFGTDLLELR